MKTKTPLTLRSDDKRLYMLAYSAGWNAAADGGNLGEHASKLGLKGSAAFHEGAAAYHQQVTSAERISVPTAVVHSGLGRGAS